MPRRKSHKIAIRTVGLTDEEAARLYYIVACGTHGLAADYQTASSVPVRVLRSTFPDDEWHIANRQERLDLVG